MVVGHQTGFNMFPLSGFYHFGLVVSDFDGALDELSSNLGIEWANVTEFEIVCEQPNGIVTADMKVVYSTTGPPHYEIIRVAPGTVWGQADLGIHHLGFGLKTFKRTMHVSLILVTCGNQHTITPIPMAHSALLTTHFETPA